MGPKQRFANTGFLSMVLVLAVLAVYSPVLLFNFTTFDDPDYVTNNPHTSTGLSWNTIVWAFTHTSSAEFHPLTMLSHAADCQLYGLNPVGHHLTNLLLHIANSLLLFYLLRSMTGAFWRSTLVTFLFALHPLNVEAVAWISERKGLLSTFFGLLCLCAYARYVSRQRQPSGVNTSPQFAISSTAIEYHTPVTGKARIFGPLKAALQSQEYLLALGLFALGLLSKPMLVTWPCLMLLLDYWPLGRFRLTDLKEQTWRLTGLAVEKLPFFALSLASCVITVVAGKTWGTFTAPGEIPLGSRLVSSLVAYHLYLKKLIWPANLSVNYQYVSHWPMGIVLTSAVVFLVFAALAAGQARRRPYIAVGWAWHLGTLIPVIGILHFGAHFMANRYNYFTAIGLFIIIVWLAAELVGTSAGRKTVAALGAVGVLAVCAVCAQSQLVYWQNGETLFRRALAVDPTDFVPYNGLAYYFDTLGEKAEAERYYRATLAINPRSSFAMEKLATLMLAKRQDAEAASLCEKALELNPRMPDAHTTLGVALMKLGQRDKAMDHYRQALEVRPDFSPAHYNLANALAGQGQLQAAQEHYRLALRWDPDSPDTHNNLAYVLGQDRKLQEAVEEFRMALKLKPGMWQAEYGLADALNRLGNAREAIEHYRLALRAKPEFPEALTQLAWSLSTNSDPQLRDGAEAARLAERACRLTGFKQARPLRALAAALAESGRFEEAAEYGAKARSAASAAGQKELSQNTDELLEAIHAGRPYRESNRP